MKRFLLAVAAIAFSAPAFAQRPAVSFTGTGSGDNTTVLETSIDMSLYTACNLVSTAGSVDVFAAPRAPDGSETSVVAQAIQLQPVGGTATDRVAATTAAQWYAFEFGPVRLLRVLQNGGTQATAFLTCWRKGD